MSSSRRVGRRKTCTFFASVLHAARYRFMNRVRRRAHGLSLASRDDLSAAVLLDVPLLAAKPSSDADSARTSKIRAQNT